MHVLMGIHMIEPQSSRAESLELRPDLSCELKPNSRQKREPHAGTSHVSVEPAVAPHETADFRRRQSRRAVDQDNMQAYPQIR